MFLHKVFTQKLFSFLDYLLCNKLSKSYKNIVPYNNRECMLFAVRKDEQRQECE